MWVELVSGADLLPEHLTAKFTKVSAEHAGSKVEFSAPIRPTAEIPTGLRGRKGTRATTPLNWTAGRTVRKVTVEPDGVQEITVTLTWNRPCGTGGVPRFKTLPGKDRIPLSNSPKATMAGPVLVSLPYAAGAEGSSNAVTFIVSLSSPTASGITVNYATQGGTAQGLSDRTAS